MLRNGKHNSFPFDLLIAFVKGAPDAPAAGVVAPGDGAGDHADDEGEHTDHLDPAEVARRADASARGTYLAQAERLVRVVEA